MDITPVSNALGATVSGIDVRNLTDGDAAALVDAWARYGVLFFRDQDLTPDDHLTFARRFGDIDVNRFFTPCLLYTSPSPRDLSTSRMPSSA